MVAQGASFVNAKSSAGEKDRDSIQKNGARRNYYDWKCTAGTWNLYLSLDKPFEFIAETIEGTCAKGDEKDGRHFTVSAVFFVVNGVLEIAL